MTNPIDFFNLFLDNEYLEMMCEYCDKYYYKYRYKPRKELNSKKKKWKKPDLVEMKAFLGLSLSMGIMDKPKIEDYWTTDPLFETPGFRETMSFDHFTQMLRCLVFYDVDNFDMTDSLYKIRSFINNIVETSVQLYEPDRYLTIDESMIKFNGRSRMKV